MAKRRVRIGPSRRAQYYGTLHGRSGSMSDEDDPSRLHLHLQQQQVNSNNNDNDATVGGDDHGSDRELSPRSSEKRHLLGRRRSSLVPAKDSASSRLLNLLKRVLSWVAMYRHYVVFTAREMRKRPVSYLIGVASCFVVVWMSLVCISALSHLGLVFLRLAENESGQFDLEVRVAKDMPGQTLDYTVVESALQPQNRTVDSRASVLQEGARESDSRPFSAPRIHLESLRAFATKYCRRDAFPEGFDEHNVDSDGSLWKQWIYSGKQADESTQHSGRRDGAGSVADPCARTAEYCVPEYCAHEGGRVSGNVVFMAVDTEREKAMGLGRTWTRGAPAPGHIYINQQLADTMGIGVGDSLILQVNTTPSLIGPLREAGIVTDETTEDKFNGIFYLPLVVDDVFYDPDGKFGWSIEQGMIADLGSFYRHLSKFLPPQYDTKNTSSTLSRVNAAKYAHRIYVNHPNDRLAVYNVNDYDTVQASILSFASGVQYLLGFDQLETRFPILEYMRTTRFFSLFVGLIVNIIVTILSVLSTVLIYSLLMINVESRVFELGIFRMLGMKKLGLLQLILVQSAVYSIPGWIFGIAAGQATYVAVSYGLAWYLQLELSWLVSLQALLISSALGIIIPILASILPARAALSANLHDSLDTRNSKTKAVKYSIERASDTKPSVSSLVVGSWMAIFGFGIYYFFPLGMLSMNATLLLYIFFGLLMSMLLGMVLLSLNFESILETLLTHTVLWWENQAVRGMVLKNLIAHRMRNRKTSIMYALSLGFIIFIAVGFSINITDFQYQKMSQMGTRLNLNADNRDALTDPLVRSQLEQFCKTEPLIQGYSYVSRSLSEVSHFDSTRLASVGNFRHTEIDIHAISPNMFRTTGDKFLVVDTQREFNGLSLDEQLYHPSGTDKALIGTFFRQELGMWDMKKPVALAQFRATERHDVISYRLLRPLAFLDKAPWAHFSKFLSQQQMQSVQKKSRLPHVLVSFPSFVRLSNGTFSSVSQIPIKTMLIAVDPSATEEQAYSLKSRLRQITDSRGISIVDVQDELAPIELAVTVMDVLFMFTTVVAMFLCFFSLMSSMYSNIQEQSKEIGVLRAIGTSKFRIVRIYIYEAFVLIMVASFLGVVTGSVLSYTMSAQRALFTQLPMALSFPWELCLIISGLAVVFAFCSSIFPIVSLLRRPVVDILRKS